MHELQALFSELCIRLGQLRGMHCQALHTAPGGLLGADAVCCCCSCGHTSCNATQLSCMAIDSDGVTVAVAPQFLEARSRQLPGMS